MTEGPFSCSECKLTLPEPPIRTSFLVGSSNGWLIAGDESVELLLLNPLRAVLAARANYPWVFTPRGR